MAETSNSAEEERRRQKALEDAREDLIEATGEARAAYFRTLGAADEDVWAPMVNPRFQGGPVWPTRPAWRRIRIGGQTIIASDGLSDPFYELEEPERGFGVEVALATADEVPADDLRRCWMFDLVYQLANHAAMNGRFLLAHQKYGAFLFSTPQDPEKYPEWVDENGEIAFLVGVPAPGISTTIELPTGNATLLMARLLTPAEYAFVAAGAEAAARQLVAKFQEDGSHHLSSLSRKSVV